MDLLRLHYNVTEILLFYYQLSVINFFFLNKHVEYHSKFGFYWLQCVSLFIDNLYYITKQFVGLSGYII